MSSESTHRSWDYRVIRDRLTAERLGSYLAATADDLDRAFDLYEWNMAASAGVLTTVAMVEVVVRNALDATLREWALRQSAPGPWFDLAPLDEHGREDMTKARARATRYGRHPEVPGKVVAELTFGFWRFLVGSRYHASLWVPATAAAFPNAVPDIRRRRRDVADRMQRLAFVRNRAAHHEPIHRRDLREDHAAAVELTGWVCADCAAWVAARSPIPRLVRERPEATAA
ncbi:MAG: hypothetical protein QOE45_892 [Frankiaceae bacterium]|jgi:hypothetical protein|nr:hypothetical protein [Frankiaceae bacterium]